MSEQYKNLLSECEAYLVTVKGYGGAKFQSIIVMKKGEGRAVSEIRSILRQSVAAQAAEKFGEDQDYAIDWQVAQEAVSEAAAWVGD